MREFTPTLLLGILLVLFAQNYVKKRCEQAQQSGYDEALAQNREREKAAFDNGHEIGYKTGLEIAEENFKIKKEAIRQEAYDIGYNDGAQKTTVLCEAQIDRIFQHYDSLMTEQEWYWKQLLQDTIGQIRGKVWEIFWLQVESQYEAFVNGSPGNEKESEINTEKLTAELPGSKIRKLQAMVCLFTAVALLALCIVFVKGRLEP